MAAGKGDLDEGLMKDVRQISGGELGEGAREGGLRGDFGPGLPTAQTVELRIVVEPVEELAGGDEIVNGFGEEGNKEGLAIRGRASGGRVRREGRGQREEADDRGQELTGLAQGSDGGFQNGEQVALEEGVELREQDGRVKLHGGSGFQSGTLVWRLTLTSTEPLKQNISGIF